MTNDNVHFIRSRMPVSLIVAPILALLLVFLSSVTHQQVSGARSDGFTGALEHLVVANHTESIRAQDRDDENTVAVEDGDTPLFWAAKPAGPFSGQYGFTATGSAFSVAFPYTVRFLLPLLRAPPLA